MHRTITSLAALALVLAACDAGTEPEPLRPDDWVIQIVQGDRQSAVVTTTYATALGAQLLQDETGATSALFSLAPGDGSAATVPVGFTAVEGELLCFDLNPDYGRTRPSCSVTDSTGVAITEPVAGEVAVDSFPVVAYTTRDTDSDGVEEVVAVDTAWLTSAPAEPTVIEMEPDSASLFLSDTALLRHRITKAEDQYGNPVPLSYLTAVVDSPWTLVDPDTVWSDLPGGGWVRVEGGSAADSILGWALRDLSPLTYLLEYACIGGGGVGQPDVDSMVVTVLTDSVVYGTALDTVPPYRVAYGYGTPDRMYYYSDGTSELQQWGNGFAMKQYPNAIILSPGDSTSIATAEAYPSMAYSGGHRCTGWDSWRPATLVTQ